MYNIYFNFTINTVNHDSIFYNYLRKLIKILKLIHTKACNIIRRDKWFTGTSIENNIKE